MDSEDPETGLADIPEWQRRGASMSAVVMLFFMAAAAWAIIILVCMAIAHAQPPEPGSEDAEQLGAYAQWIEGQKGNSGGLCRSLSDCRVVDWRAVKDGRIEAYLVAKDSRGHQKFYDAPNAWVDVPDEVIKHGEQNPTGRAIACWSAYRANDAGFYCFFLPDLT